MATGVQTGSDYIKHHLTNLTFGKSDDGTWKIAETAQEAQEMGFYAIHLDSMGWSIVKHRIANHTTLCLMIFFNYIY